MRKNFLSAKAKLDQLVLTADTCRVIHFSFGIKTNYRALINAINFAEKEKSPEFSKKGYSLRWATYENSLLLWIEYDPKWKEKEFSSNFSM
ncbi:MAG TPA: hypothetical protein DGG95_06870 [Cytophagales bacterium]|jgi:hypothetical protein|nr:hypothetical protein [Cytophagales bacterium]